MEKIAIEAEKLIQFALKNGMIEKWDVIPCRNSLIDLLGIDEPFCGEVQGVLSPVPVLEKILDYAVQKGLIADDTTTCRDLFDARIMGLLMPGQSEVIKNFMKKKREQGIEKATDDFYAMSINSNYIRMDRIEKNLYWLANTEYGDLEITVNLSKPEKDPKDIAAAKARPQSNYPKCLLCIENVGYAGHISHPARQNHRVIPVTLSGQQWYFQYSPYVYYNEHCIVFNEKHIPMKVTRDTFVRLFDFLKEFPHYLIGSNADLPIVGGSILTHDHFQGGHHVFPMEKAPSEMHFYNKDYPEIEASIVKWPMSVIRLASKNNDELVSLSNSILEDWREYSDSSVDILAYSDINGSQVPHNTITPIARINKDGLFEIDLVLRNNRTSEEHPDGIFHPHKELHHIKKENIGLIEVMGLAVLPGRLNKELAGIAKILSGEEKYNDKGDSSYPLLKHKEWINELMEKYKGMNSYENALSAVSKEVGNKFLKVLLDAGVFKRNEQGKNAFINYLKHMGFTLK